MAEPLTDEEIAERREWMEAGSPCIGPARRWLATVDARDSEIARLKADVEELQMALDEEREVSTRWEVRERAEKAEAERDTIAGQVVALKEEADAEITRLTGRAVVAEAERDQLRDLCAVLNRDGGHRQIEVGTKQAVKEAMQRYYDVIGERDALEVQVAGILDRLRDARQDFDDDPGVPWDRLVEAIDGVLDDTEATAKAHDLPKSPAGEQVPAPTPAEGDAAEGSGSGPGLDGGSDYDECAGCEGLNQKLNEVAVALGWKPSGMPSHLTANDPLAMAEHVMGCLVEALNEVRRAREEAASLRARVTDNGDAQNE